MKVLKNKTDLPSAECSPLRLGKPVQIVPQDPNCACIGSKHTAKREKQGRLAGPTGTAESDQFARFKLKIDVGKGGYACIPCWKGPRHIAQFNDHTY